MDKVVIVTYMQYDGTEVYAVVFQNIRDAMLGMLGLKVEGMTNMKLYRAEEITW